MTEEYVETGAFQQAMLKAMQLRAASHATQEAEKGVKSRLGFSLIKNEGLLSEQDKQDIAGSIVNMLNTTPAISATAHLNGYLAHEEFAVDYKSTYFKQIAEELNLQQDKDLEVAEHATRKSYEHAVLLKRIKYETLEAVAAATAMNGPVEVRNVTSSSLENVTVKMLPTVLKEQNGKDEYQPTVRYGQLADQYCTWLGRVRSWVAARSKEGLIEHTEVYREVDRLMVEFKELYNQPSVIMSSDMVSMLTGNTMYVLPSNEAIGVVNTSSVHVAVRVDGDVSTALPLIKKGGKLNHLEASRRCEVGQRFIYKEMMASPRVFNQNVVAPKVLLLECTPLPTVTQLVEKLKAVWVTVLGPRHAEKLVQELTDSLRSAWLDKQWYTVAFKNVPVSTTHKDFVRIQCKDVQLEIMTSKEKFSYIQNTVAKATPVHVEPAHGYDHIFYAPANEDVPHVLYLTGEKPIIVHKGSGMQNAPGIYKTCPVLTRLAEWPKTEKDWRLVGLYKTMSEAAAAIDARDQYVKRMQEAEAAAAKLEREQEALKQQLKDKEAALELERKKHADIHALQQKKHEEELALKAEELRVKKEAGIRDANLREAKQEAEILDMRFKGYVALEELKQKSRDALYKGLEIVTKSSGSSGSATGLLGILSGLAGAGQGVGLGDAFRAVGVYTEHLSAEERHDFVQAMYATEISGFNQLANWLEKKHDRLERKREVEAEADKRRASYTVTPTYDAPQSSAPVHQPSSTSYTTSGGNGGAAPAVSDPPKYKPNKTKKFVKAAAVGLIAAAGGLFFGLGALVAAGAGILIGGIAAI